MKRPYQIMGFLAAIVGAAWLLSRALSGSPPPPTYTVHVLREYPHDKAGFTEGLIYRNGNLIESTGQIGASAIKEIDVDTGLVQNRADLSPPYFGEGIAAWGNKIVQLTWKNRTGFVYEMPSLSPVSTFNYEGEGWGITHNSKYFIMSNGTSILKFLDPKSFSVKYTINVKASNCPVNNLNELEWIDGQIYANIWQTGFIARIDPKTGAVTSFIDASALGPRDQGVDDVLNGIAYDNDGRRLFITGKRWPVLYQIAISKEALETDVARQFTQC
jgi:glutaminyl-peptide cyclotransferase